MDCGVLVISQNLMIIFGATLVAILVHKMKAKVRITDKTIWR